MLFSTWLCASSLFFSVPIKDSVNNQFDNSPFNKSAEFSYGLCSFIHYLMPLLLVKIVSIRDRTSVQLFPLVEVVMLFIVSVGLEEAGLLPVDGLTLLRMVGYESLTSLLDLSLAKGLVEYYLLVSSCLLVEDFLVLVSADCIKQFINFIIYAFIDIFMMLYNNFSIEMNISDSSSSIETRPHKNKYQFPLDKSRKIVIDSNFDNGNIGFVKQMKRMLVSAGSSHRHQKQQLQKNMGPKYSRIKIMIENVKIYENMYEEKNWMKPVIKDDKNWREIKDAYLLYRDQIALVFEHNFLSDSFVQIALTIPFGYYDSQQYLQSLNEKIPQNIFYKDQIIGNSLRNLNTHLLTITHKESAERNKPVILITARVHPGEVSSSYCLMGMIDFLLKPFNLQSYILRNMFKFLIIPMVNPDGVYEGNFRMDLNGINLNRVYNDPSPQIHPTVYAIKQTISKVALNNKIFAHFDLHSHSSLKNAFIYGNALDDIISQTETQLYCKLLEQNCEIFRYSLSQFGEKHMKMKDRGEPLSKEGCARVVIGKLANILHSYTIETSIFTYLNRQALEYPQKNENWDLVIEQNGVCLGYEKPSIQILQSKGIESQLIADNMVLGYNLLISILDVVQKNPYTRFCTQSIEAYRKEIAQELFQTEERFKLLDLKANQKAKYINKYTKEYFSDKYAKLWNFLAYQNTFCRADWPEGFRWFEREIEKRKMRYKTDIPQTNFPKTNDIIVAKNPRKYFFQAVELLPHKSSIVFANDQSQKTQEESKKISQQVQTQKDEIKKVPRVSLKRIPSSSFYAQNQLKQIIKLRERESGSLKRNMVLDMIEEEMQKMVIQKKNAVKGLPSFGRIFNSKVAQKEKKKSKSTKLFDGNYKVQLGQKKVTQISMELLSQRNVYKSQQQKVKKQPNKTRKKELAQAKLGQLKRKEVNKDSVKLPNLGSNSNLMIRNKGKASTLPDQY